ncbi:uncharacterized protein FAM241B isoform X3 [Camelus bactrianus]|uniref:Uncharacterized protein FAM241B isoform X3 n=1 Tax=Camelus bactrianus TaxID=9837 RepID=A0AC58R6S5_CAMBA
MAPPGGISMQEHDLHPSIKSSSLLHRLHVWTPSSRSIWQGNGFLIESPGSAQDESGAFSPRNGSSTLGGAGRPQRCLQDVTAHQADPFQRHDSSALCSVLCGLLLTGSAPLVAAVS